MPWAIAAPVVGAIASSALAPSGGGGGGTQYTPAGLNAADLGWQQMQQSQMGLYNQGNPYAGGYQSAAGQAGQTYGGLAGTAGQYAGQLGQQAQKAYGAQDYLQGAGQQVFNLGLDPQSALYNRTQQQLGEQINVGQAQRGLGGSAVGGAEYNQGMSNFNIDWQNQQLQRASQGLQGLNAAYGQAGRYGEMGGAELAQGLTMGQQGAGYQLQAGQLPYQTQQGITNAQLGQAQSIQNQAIPYMNYGQGAQQSAYANQAQAAGATGALVSQGVGALSQAPWGEIFGGGGTPSGGVGMGSAGLGLGAYNVPGYTGGV